MKITITEALAELKTIKKRVQKKHDSIVRYFARQANVRDPLEKDGGSVEFIKQERQAIKDLHGRFIALREGIQASNLSTILTVCGQTLNVAQWLTWRRELSESERQHISSLIDGLQNVRDKARKQGLAITKSESGDVGEVVICINEVELARESEHIEEVLGVLDGKLSLLNATTTI